MEIRISDDWMEIHGSAWIVTGITFAIIPKGNDELLTSLRHGDIHSRRIAAQALINIGDADRHLATMIDSNALLEALDDEDADVRYFRGCRPRQTGSKPQSW